MKKKILVSSLAIMLIAAFAATTVFSDSWVDKGLTLTATATTTQSLALYTDCQASTPATSHDFGMVAQGNSYEWTVYVLNTGALGMYISYLPTAVVGQGGQQAMLISVAVIEYGNPCQVQGPIPAIGFAGTGVTALPYLLPEKAPATPEQGFFLMPSKMIKIDIKLTVLSVDAGSVYTIPFTVAGVNTGVNPP